MKNFRDLTTFERSLIEHMLTADFPGCETIRCMISSVQAITIDENNSLKLYVGTAAKAAVLKRVPVEAEAPDKDGVIIHVLLHVIDGRLNELEIFREDSQKIQKMPEVAAFDLIVLPPMNN